MTAAAFVDYIALFANYEQAIHEEVANKYLTCLQQMVLNINIQQSTIITVKNSIQIILAFGTLKSVTFELLKRDKKVSFNNEIVLMELKP